MPPTLKIDRYKARARFFPETLPSGVSLPMVEIPPGTFTMGSPKNEEERSDAEGPQHLVTLSRFFIAKTPTTQAQWRAVASLKPIKQELDLEPANFKGEDRPVEQVSWHDATEFCARLSARTGRTYTLPSEAQWEYACRAGMQTPFHFGETITTDLANYDGTDDPSGNWKGSYGRGSTGEYRQETTPVAQFPANDFGLFDMHGNMWEWCLDDWHGNYEGAPADGSAWLTSNSNAKILRGGSWGDVPRLCRSASRFYGNLVSYDLNGFRVVCLPQDSA